MRTLSLLLSLALVTFSGCTDPAEGVTDDETPTDGGGDGGAGDTNGTGGEDSLNETNTAPLANLTADVLNGTAPLGVVLYVNVSDADGDDLAWALSVNGTQIANGTESGAVNHTFEAGTFAVVLSVDDGTAKATSMLTIVVTHEAAAEPVTLTGSVATASTPVGSELGADQCIGWAAGENGLDCYWWPADPSWAGRPYTGTGTNIYAHWLSSCSTDATSVALQSVGDDQTVPDGAGCVVSFLYAATASGALSITIE